jgi:hypothetical protein
MTRNDMPKDYVPSVPSLLTGSTYNYMSRAVVLAIGCAVMQ